MADEEVSGEGAKDLHLALLPCWFSFERTFVENQ